MPVPAACSLLYCSVVLMMTRLGSTFFSTAASLADVPGAVLGGGTGLLLGIGTAGAAGAALMLGAGAAEELDVGWYSATTVPAPRAPAASATAT
jgi:hypothetical protein